MLAQTRSLHPDPVITARKNRRQASPAARLLWSALRCDQLGARFRRQHPAGRRLFDFYCPQHRLVITISDEGAVCLPSGYRQLCLSSREILQELPSVLRRIEAALETV